MCFQFMNTIAGGVDFGKGIVELYSQLLNAKREQGDKRRGIIERFTEEYYSKNQTGINKALKKMEKDWTLAENNFFREVESVFGKVRWPKGKYVSYLSVFDINPRFLEDKTFQVFYRHILGSNYVIAHEMLHFIFFSYFENQEPELSKSLDEHTIWLLSEWFNDIVLDLPEFEGIGSGMMPGYPEVKDFSKRFGIINKNGFNVQKFFETVKVKI